MSLSRIAYELLTGAGGERTRPRFKNAIDSWPRFGDQIPRPFIDGRPNGEARAVLAKYVPSLPEERRTEIARFMTGEYQTIDTFQRILREHAPELFEVE